MSALRWTAVVLLALVGLVWIGQGLGLIGGSVMSNDTRWAWIGAGLLVIAAVLAWRGIATSRR